MRKLFICLVWLAAPAWAQDWQDMNGDDIRMALEGRKLVYENAWQDFRASGRTLYNAGRDSWGYWRVENDRYCSLWPPSDLWECYQMQRDGQTLRFVDNGGHATTGVYAE